MTSEKKHSMPKIDFAVGGQAVIEGVMMRSPNFVTVAVRKKEGEIKIKDERFYALAMKIKLLGIPLVRGVVNLFEMMSVGMRVLNFSASEALEDQENEREKKFQKLENKRKEAEKKVNELEKTLLKNETSKETSKKSDSSLAEDKNSSLKTSQKTAKIGVENVPQNTWQKVGAVISVIFSFAFALGLSLFLFKFLPLWITDFLSKTFTFLNENYLLYNFLDGIIKTIFFVVYIWILGKMPSMHRVFQYHGAEHKSIYTYEQGLELTVQNAKKMTRFHPRCGTSFILVVFLISIFIYTFLPRQPDFWMNFLVRVAFLPLVAGTSYEILKWSAKHAEHSLVKIITLPGLLFQRITTQEPDESQLEVALSALKKALELEENLRLQPQVAANVP